MTLTVGMLLSKRVHSMQSVPIPRSFLFKELLAMKCLDGHKNVKLILWRMVSNFIKYKDEHFLFSCVQYESCNTYKCRVTF